VNPKGPASEDRLHAGRVGRAHGLDGSFYVTGARSRLLELGTDVTIAGRTAAIVRRAGTEERPIVRLHGVEDRTGAQELRGQTLEVAAADAPDLAEGEWWAHELEGCRVLDGARCVGTVIRMIELPSCEALEVRLELSDSDIFDIDPTDHSDTDRTDSDSSDANPSNTDIESLLVPMVKDAIRRVDVAAGVIDVNMDFIED